MASTECVSIDFILLLGLFLINVFINSVDDEWVKLADVTPHRYVPFHKIPHAVKVDLAHEWKVFRPGTGDRKMKQVPPPPPSLPSPPLNDTLPRVNISPPTVEQFLQEPTPELSVVVPEKVRRMVFGERVYSFFFFVTGETETETDLFKIKKSY